MIKKLLSYIVTFIVATVIVLVVLGINGVFNGGMVQIDVIRHVCDAFFIAGVLIICVGALAWASNMGTFDGVNYAVKSFFSLHFSTKRYDWTRGEDFADYKERVHTPERKKKTKNFVVIGGLFLLVSIILLIVYYCA